MKVREIELKMDSVNHGIYDIHINGENIGYCKLVDTEEDKFVYAEKIGLKITSVKDEAEVKKTVQEAILKFVSKLIEF